MRYNFTTRKAALVLMASTALLTGCVSTASERQGVTKPAGWTSAAAEVPAVDPASLKNWWKGFNDPTLNTLVDMALKGSPDRALAKARLMEARGLRKATTSSLFPQIGLSGTSGRQKDVATGTGDFYEAGFDATFELDLFGRNRKASSAADKILQAREAEYQQASLSLVAEVARTYIETRAAEKQAAIAQKNLEAQQKTLDLITHQKTQGEAPQLDVERAQGLVNTTKAEIPEYLRIADNARLRLTVLTGSMPAQIRPVLDEPSAVTPATIRPVMTTPAQVLALRPDVAAASSLLAAQADLTQSAIAEIFPRITLGAFFGLQDSKIIDPTRIWSGTINAVVSLLDFGRIQGNIDAAQAREDQAYEVWRKTVLQAVTDVETALTDYSKIQERSALLKAAAANAAKSLDLSEQLYKEGEISFLDVLDSQRTRNNADAAVVAAEAAQSQSLISLYKSLGVY